MSISVTLGLGGAIALGAYLLGSFPTGFLITWWLKGLDIREQGSGSTGATNVLRTVGKGAALTVLIVDALKGAFAVGLVLRLGQTQGFSLTLTPWLVVIAGLAAIVGHSRPVWLRFRGGKSVATGIGVILTMNFWVGLATIAVFGLLLAIGRIVSLGSMGGAIAVPILMLVFKQPLPYCLLGAIAALYVIWRHQANLRRLLAGTEPKIGQKLPVDPSTPTTP